MAVITVSLTPEVNRLIDTIARGSKSATINRILREHFLTVEGIACEISHFQNIIDVLKKSQQHIKKEAKDRASIPKGLIDDISNEGIIPNWITFTERMNYKYKTNYTAEQMSHIKVRNVY